MLKRFFLSPLAALVPLLLFIGCATDRYAVQQKEVPPITLSEKGITVIFAYLTEDQLLERFGERDNPFIPPPSAFGLNNTFVFEISIESQVDAEIILNKLELQFDRGVDSPKNIFHFENYWDVELTKGDTQKHSLHKIKYVIKQNLLPNKLSVSKSSIYTGLIVFQGRLPQYGGFTLYFPVFDKNVKLIHNFKYDIEL